MLAVGIRLIAGRVVVVKDFTSTGGGVIATGAMIANGAVSRGNEIVDKSQIKVYRGVEGT